MPPHAGMHLGAGITAGESPYLTSNRLLTACPPDRLQEGAEKTHVRPTVKAAGLGGMISQCYDSIQSEPLYHKKKHTNTTMKLSISLILAAAAILMAPAAKAEQFGIKTNLLYDATATVNLGAEMRVAPRWSVDLSGNFNGWDVNGHKWKHWLVQPEARYWFCDATAGHFVGAHLLGGQYNIGNVDLGSLNFLGTDLSHLKDYRYQGWFVGAGVAYGYTWILGRHWNLEAELGVGWIYTRFDKYPCAECGTKLYSRRPHNYVGPTKLALNLVYIF